MSVPQTPQTWTAAEMLAAQSECVSIAYDKRQEACAVRNDKLASMLRYAAASAEREAALRAALMDWENREATVCPEDRSFEEMLAVKDAEIARLTKELANARR